MTSPQEAVQGVEQLSNSTTSRQEQARTHIGNGKVHTNNRLGCSRYLVEKSSAELRPDNACLTTPLGPYQRLTRTAGNQLASNLELRVGLVLRKPNPFAKFCMAFTELWCSVSLIKCKQISLTEHLVTGRSRLSG